jgi:hypothetical protein
MNRKTKKGRVFLMVLMSGFIPQSCFSAGRGDNQVLKTKNSAFPPISSGDRLVAPKKTWITVPSVKNVVKFVGAAATIGLIGYRLGERAAISSFNTNANAPANDLFEPLIVNANAPAKEFYKHSLVRNLIFFMCLRAGLRAGLTAGLSAVFSRLPETSQIMGLGQALGQTATQHTVLEDELISLLKGEQKNVYLVSSLFLKERRYTVLEDKLIVLLTDRQKFDYLNKRTQSLEKKLSDLYQQVQSLAETTEKPLLSIQLSPQDSVNSDMFRATTESNDESICEELDLD